MILYIIPGFNAYRNSAANAAIQAVDYFNVFFQQRISGSGGHIPVPFNGQDNVGVVRRVVYCRVAPVRYRLALRYSEK
jgi:hypothetical protein